ncbi:DUF1592 domain-containing protein [Calycomorphotria hydatis]|uniref:DUF1592 domain-containing protein n=1 Tax=Calycomorphotria hydatis TaxID=2528027 RepID=UPI0018D23C54|nr:DUF1592 domain-containing protein [Calycomorphotria hydatis]
MSTISSFLHALLFASLAFANPDVEFLNANCLDCHSGPESEGALDLTSLMKHTPRATQETDRWIRIYDRVATGEMPPKDYTEVSEVDRTKFLTGLKQDIESVESRKFREVGRVQGRQLTMVQVERSLQDLLGIDIPLAKHFPADPRTHGYTTVADGQPMSLHEMDQHLACVDIALEEAFRRAFNPNSDLFQKRLDYKTLSRTNPRRRCREPEILYDLAVVWHTGMEFYGRLPSTTAKEDGWYRFKLRAKALNQPEGTGVWCSVRSGRCVSSAPLLDWVSSFETQEQMQEWEFVAWLDEGDMIEVRPKDKKMKSGRFQGGQVGAGEGEPQNIPGIAMEWLDVERFHNNGSDEELRQKLFDSLEIVPHKDWRQGKLKTDKPKREIIRLVKQFAESAFRRPVDDKTAQPYIDFAVENYSQTKSVKDALFAGYRAILCSPRFLYLQEQPGELDSYAIASRMSYMLWNSVPDQQLLDLAAAGQLQDREAVLAQVDRMLDDPKSARFREDFTNQWLDLSQIDFTEPDRRLYREYDGLVQQSMVDETRAFVNAMLDEDLSVTNLIDSDFSFMNTRLVRYYGIDGSANDRIERVSLPADSMRGGLLGHGAIQKITANGTETSPVTRGVWVSERLLGKEIPPPPTSVPAIEPDIRGAKSIRDQLEKHKSVESCAACHRHIDPPGYALEHFDPAGQWRQRYRSPGKKNGKWIPGPEIDTSYQLSDGRGFNDLEEFRQRILANPEQLAKGAVGHFLTYGTGSPVQFADRDEVDRIVAHCANTDYGFRSLLKSAIASRVFLTK